MDTKKTLLWITRTAVLTALLITLQWSMGIISGNNQIFVGSAVNFVLIAAALTSGLSSAVTVAIISPFTAFLFGVGPRIELLPFIALGNIVIVLVWNLIAKNALPNIQGFIRMGIALALGSLLKFITLYLSIVKFAIPVILKLPENKAAAVAALFSYPQIITAAIGGVLAIAAVPLIKIAISKKQ